jgi:hypothetical protein
MARIGSGSRPIGRSALWRMGVSIQVDDFLEKLLRALNFASPFSKIAKNWGNSR